MLWKIQKYAKITQITQKLRKNYANYASPKKLRRLRTPHFADGLHILPKPRRLGACRCRPSAARAQLKMKSGWSCMDAHYMPGSESESLNTQDAGKELLQGHPVTLQLGQFDPVDDSEIYPRPVSKC